MLLRLLRTGTKHHDHVRLGAAIEAANQEVIDAPAKVLQTQHGSTLLLSGNQMAVAHVGTLAFTAPSWSALLHDHSHVEESIDSGQIGR